VKIELVVNVVCNPQGTCVKVEVVVKVGVQSKVALCESGSGGQSGQVI
jgi:hypothetical protein